MTDSVGSSFGADSPDLVEGTARVVAIEGKRAWLIPEQTSSCGHCPSSGGCASKSIGSLESRLEMRRFAIDNASGLVVGERVVVGIAQDALVKASLMVYVLPLVITMIAGIAAQSLYGSDAITMLSMGSGLVLGFGATWLGARLLAARGKMAPRLLRRAGSATICHIE